MPARASLVKHAVSGRLASVKSKTGLPQCSQAASAWAKHQATPAIFAILARCRAAAKLGKHALLERKLAGQGGSEAKAQHLIHRITSGQPLATKERTAKAKELRSRLAESRAARAERQSEPVRPSLREQVAAHRMVKGTTTERIARLRERLGAKLPAKSPLSEDRPKQHPPFMATIIAANESKEQYDMFGGIIGSRMMPKHSERVESNRTGTRFWYSKSNQGFMSSYDSTTSKSRAARWAVAVAHKARLGRIEEQQPPSAPAKPAPRHVGTIPVRRSEGPVRYVPDRMPVRKPAPKPSVAPEPIRKGTAGLIHTFKAFVKGRGRRRLESAARIAENLMRSHVAVGHGAKAARVGEHLAKIRRLATA